MNYALTHWSKVEKFIADGRIEIDNNLCENAIRPLKLGSKNYLFIGNAEAGWVAATMYTLVENCRRHGLDAYRYLTDTLAGLPAGDLGVQDAATFTPARVAGVRPSEKRDAAA